MESLQSQKLLIDGLKIIKESLRKFICREKKNVWFIKIYQPQQENKR